MSQHIDAIYENGVLKPLQPLSLPEQARVSITVESSDVSDSNEYQQQLADLKEKLRIAEQQSARGEVGPFDAEATKKWLHDEIAKNGISE